MKNRKKKPKNSPWVWGISGFDLMSGALERIHRRRSRHTQKKKITEISIRKFTELKKTNHKLLFLSTLLKISIIFSENRE